MHRLACVLFQLATVNAHLARPCRRFHDNFATTNNGIIQLANLITLGQIRIKIILAHEECVRINLRANRQAKQRCEPYRLRIEHRQHPRIAQINFIHVGIRLGTESRRR